MTAGTIAMLVGLFGIPLLLLWGGHRLRRRSARHRAAFWGALIGYGIAAVAALAVSIYPAAMWSSDDTIRGLLGMWSFVIVPLLGAMVGAAGAQNTPR